MSEKKETPKLSPAIEGKFEAVGVLPGVITGKKFGTVDLRSISLEQAEELVKKGFPYLKKSEKAVKAEALDAKKQ
ncbi:MAG: hypothetical protein ACK4SF_04485 [Algoriphagus aquaeductus]|uniref:hypothetical protein n=1 Tax=Algoriphagus aquaeductus TaxID=475299 RepID=UPI00391BC1B9